MLTCGRGEISNDGTGSKHQTAQFGDVRTLVHGCAPWGEAPAEALKRVLARSSGILPRSNLDPIRPQPCLRPANILHRGATCLLKVDRTTTAALVATLIGPVRSQAYSSHFAPDSVATAYWPTITSKVLCISPTGCAQRSTSSSAKARGTLCTDSAFTEPAQAWRDGIQ